MTPQHFEQALEYHRAVRLGIIGRLNKARADMDCTSYCLLKEQLADHNREIMMLLTLRDNGRIAEAEIDIRGYRVKS